jgi:hypothetical protein
MGAVASTPVTAEHNIVKIQYLEGSRAAPESQVQQIHSECTNRSGQRVGEHLSMGFQI